MGVQSSMCWLQRGECVAERRQEAVGDFYTFCFIIKQQQLKVINDVNKRGSNAELNGAVLPWLSQMLAENERDKCCLSCNNFCQCLYVQLSWCERMNIV